MRQKLYIDSNWFNVEYSECNSWIWSQKLSRFIISEEVSCLTFIINSNVHSSKTVKLTHGNKSKEFSLTDGPNTVSFFLDTSCKFPSTVVLETDVFIPKNVDPTSSDFRELGQCISHIRLDGEMIPLNLIINGEFLLKKTDEDYILDCLKTYCITLRSTPVREKYVRDVLQKHDINCKIFYGVDANELGITSQTTLRQVFDKIDTWVSVGQVGCFLSHYMLWQMLLNDGGEYYLIFEDDIILPNNFQKQLQSKFLFVPDDWDIVFIGHESLNGVKHSIVNEFVAEGIPACTYAYMIRKSTIPILLRELSTVKYPVDTQIRYNCFNKLKSYCLNPKLVSQKSSLIETSSETTEKSLTYDWEINPYGISR